MSRRILKSLRARLVKAAGIVARSRNLALATVLFGAMFVAMDTLLLPSDSKAGRMLHGPPNRRVSGYVSGYAVESDGARRSG